MKKRINKFEFQVSNQFACTYRELVESAVILSPD